MSVSVIDHAPSPFSNHAARFAATPAARTPLQ